MTSMIQQNKYNKRELIYRKNNLHSATNSILKVKKLKQKPKTENILYQHINPKLTTRKYIPNRITKKKIKLKKTIIESEKNTSINSCKNDSEKVNVIEGENSTEIRDSTIVQKEPTTIEKQIQLLKTTLIDYSDNIDDVTFPRTIQTDISENVSKPLSTPRGLRDLLKLNHSINVKRLTTNRLSAVLGGREYLVPKVLVKKLSDKYFKQYCNTLNNNENKTDYSNSENINLRITEEEDGNNCEEMDDYYNQSGALSCNNLSPSEIWNVIGANVNNKVNLVKDDNELTIYIKEIKRQNNKTLNPSQTQQMENVRTSTGQSNSDRIIRTDADIDLLQKSSDDGEKKLSSVVEASIARNLECNIKKLESSSSNNEETRNIRIEAGNMLRQLSNVNQIDEVIDLARKGLSNLLINFRHLMEDNRQNIENIARKSSGFSKQGKQKFVEKIEEHESLTEKLLLEVKKKQWCTFCREEARFHCCWKTSYCSHQCQANHWQHHYKYCAQYNKVGATDPNITQQSNYKELFKKSSYINPVYIKELLTSTSSASKGVQRNPNRAIINEQTGTIPCSSSSNIIEPCQNAILINENRNSNLIQNYNLPGLEILQKHPHLNAKIEKMGDRNKIVISTSGKNLEQESHSSKSTGSINPNIINDGANNNGNDVTNKGNTTKLNIALPINNLSTSVASNGVNDYSLVKSGSQIKNGFLNVVNTNTLMKNKLKLTNNEESSNNKNQTAICGKQNKIILVPIKSIVNPSAIKTVIKKNKIMGNISNNHNGPTIINKLPTFMNTQYRSKKKNIIIPKRELNKLNYNPVSNVIVLKSNFNQNSSSSA